MEGPNLQASPFELGMSRADLWAFAGILALDEAQRTTRSQCDNFNYENTCGDNSTTCFTPFPRDTKDLFKTGRKDCIDFGDKPYKATKEESHPNAVGNGKMTLDFFKKDFGFSGRETVAIFGAHTFGRMYFDHSMFRYTWTSQGTRMFNNHYYRFEEVLNSKDLRCFLSKYQYFIFLETL